jgi:hypothetical protein
VGELPAAVDSCVLFTKAGLRRLRLRTGELEAECAALREQLRALQGEERALQTEKRLVEAGIARVREECAAVMLLKFGKPIDVEALDKATAAASSDLASLAEEQLKFERGAEADLAERHARLAALQASLTALTRAHTGSLEAAASLSARLEALEGELSGRVDTGLNAVALHASLGTPLATAVAQGKFGAGSLSALRPVMAAATKRALAAGAEPDSLNLPAAVTAGLTLSAKAGGGGEDDSVAKAQEAAERARLAQLVAHQAATLEGLRAQLAVLRTKSEAAATEVFARSQGLSGTSAAATQFVKAMPPPRAPAAARAEHDAEGGGGGGGGIGPLAGRATMSARTMVAPVFASTVKRK